MVRGLILACALIVAGCAGTKVCGDFCVVNHPRILSPAVIAAMSIEEKRLAVEHNTKGEKLCGWKPRKG